MKRKDDWIEDLYYREFIKPKLQPKDFYWEDGRMVMTEGYCCGNNCRHCPYTPNHQQNNKVLTQ